MANPTAPEATAPEAFSGRTLPRALFGYSRAAVDELLKHADQEFDRITWEMRSLTELVKDLEGKLAVHDERALAAQEALVMVQEVRRETLDEAAAQAERMIDEARVEAEEIKADAAKHAKREIARASANVERLEAQVVRLEARRREFLDFLQRELQSQEPGGAQPPAHEPKPLDVRFRRRRSSTGSTQTTRPS